MFDRLKADRQFVKYAVTHTNYLLNKLPNYYDNEEVVRLAYYEVSPEPTKKAKITAA